MKNLGYQISEDGITEWRVDNSGSTERRDLYATEKWEYVSTPCPHTPAGLKRFCEQGNFGYLPPFRQVTVSIGEKVARLRSPSVIIDEIGDARKIEDGDLIGLAVQKLYGKTCWWWSDSGLGIYYGQVCYPVPQKLGGGNNCITSRVRADVKEGW